jgi:uncharacterized YccA/Bax inhibitor family protein
MRSSNPILNEKTFDSFSYIGSDTMTIQGTTNKALIMFGLLLAGAAFTWMNMNTNLAMPLMLGGAIGGFIVAMITIYKQEWAPKTAPIYAILEGLFIGGISSYFDARFPGIVIQAVSLTFGVFFCLLFCYKSGLIKATENFKLGVVAATGAIALVYMASMILRMFGTSIPFIHESGMIGIGFSLVVVVVASMNLILDFDFIEDASTKGAPKYMEWYGAFGLLLTLVWLYLEMLRLLSKLSSNRD